MRVPALAGRTFFHICTVVADLDAALDRFSAVWEVGEWRIYTLGPENVVDVGRGGQPLDFSFRLAITEQSPQLELIQPLSGNSPYAAWLAERGEVAHHAGVVVGSVADVVSQLRECGCELLYWARGYGDAEWAYFDTVADLGFVLEAVQPPSVVPEPDAIWTPA